MSSNQEVIERGMHRFILIRGLQGWGVTTASIVQLIIFITSDKSYFEGLTTSLIAFPIGKILYGDVTWMMILNRFRKIK